MNAKIILAAVAAICCVQGIAAASLAKPAPWTPMEVTAELADMDFDEILDQIIMMVDEMEQESGLELNLNLHALKQERAVKNIFTCATSVLNLFKTLKQVKALYDEFHAEKVAYKAAQQACTEAAGADATPDADCLAAAETTYAAAYKASKAKLPATAVKALTSLAALKLVWEVSHNVKVVRGVIASKRQLKKDTAACAALAEADAKKACQDKAVADDAARWAAMKLDVAFVLADVVFVPVVTYYNCINLLA